MDLTQVLLFTSDVRALAAFYVDRIGMLPMEGSGDEGFVRLRGASGAVLALHSRGRGRSGDRSADPVKLCFHVDDVAAARAELVSKGVPFGAVRAAGEIAICDGTDPDGNVIQLTSRA